MPRQQSRWASVESGKSPEGGQTDQPQRAKKSRGRGNEQRWSTGAPDSPRGQRWSSAQSEKATGSARSSHSQSWQVSVDATFTTTSQPVSTFSAAASSMCGSATNALAKAPAPLAVATKERRAPRAFSASKGRSWADIMSDDDDSSLDGWKASPTASRSKAAASQTATVMQEPQSDQAAGNVSEVHVDGEYEEQVQCEATNGVHAEDHKGARRHEVSTVDSMLGSSVQDSVTHTSIAHGISADSWAAEVFALASRLQALATQAPQAPLRQFAEVATDICAEDVSRWEDSADLLQRARVEAHALEAEAEAAEARANEAEDELTCVSSAATEIQQEIAKEGQALQRHAEQRAEFENSVDKLLAYRLAAATADADAATRAHARLKELDQLRENLAAEAAANTAIEDDLTRFEGVKSRAGELKAAKERRSGAEAEVSQLEAARGLLRKACERTRAERDAFQAKSDQKAETLEARIATLESECQTLQEALRAGDENSDCEETPRVSTGAVVSNASFAIAQQLVDAQERNRRLAADAREARGERDGASAELKALRAEVATMQTQYLLGSFIVPDLANQVRDMEEGETAARLVVGRLKMRFAELQKNRESVEESVVDAGHRHRQIEKSLEETMRRRPEFDKTLYNLEQELQVHLDKMAKDKKTEAWARSLNSTRPPAMASRGGLSCSYKGAYGGWPKGVDGHQRPQHHVADSDATDADVSTTAGESICEGFLPYDVADGIS